VLVVPGKVTKEESYDQVYQRSREAIGQAVEAAEKLDIHILIENVWNNFLLSPLEAADYVDAFGSRKVGWYFDVGNVVRYGWPEQWIRILGRRIKKLDIKEYSRDKQFNEGTGKGFGVKLLEGDCDWPTVMAELGKIDFDGWGTAEVSGGGEKRLRDISERMDRILAS
jgi:hexulose-6-phosphate isomerase